MPAVRFGWWRECQARLSWFNARMSSAAPITMNAKTPAVVPASSSVGQLKGNTRSRRNRMVELLEARKGRLMGNGPKQFCASWSWAGFRHLPASSSRSNGSYHRQFLRSSIQKGILDCPWISVSASIQTLSTLAPGRPWGRFFLFLRETYQPAKP